MTLPEDDPDKKLFNIFVGTPSRLGGEIERMVNPIMMNANQAAGGGGMILGSMPGGDGCGFGGMPAAR